MKITEREDKLLRRALDPASSPAEADTAAKAFIASLRERGVDPYAYLAPRAQPRPQSPPGPATRPPEQPPTAGWPNQWRNAEQQASEAAQAEVWQRYHAFMQAQAQNDPAWANAAMGAAQANTEPEQMHPPEPKPGWWTRLKKYLKNQLKF